MNSTGNIGGNGWLQRRQRKTKTYVDRQIQRIDGEDGVAALLTGGGVQLDCYIMC